MKTAAKVQLFFHICKFFFKKVNIFFCAPAAGGGARGRMGAAWSMGWRWGGCVGWRVGGWGGVGVVVLGGVWAGIFCVYHGYIALLLLILYCRSCVVPVSFLCRSCVVLSSDYHQTIIRLYTIYVLYMLNLCSIYAQSMF